jgi:type I restriction enzyme, R subunit
VFSSNGDGFVFHDRTVTSGVIEKNLSLDEFPSPGTLWARYREWQGLLPEADEVVLQDYYTDTCVRSSMTNVRSKSFWL